MNLKVKFILTYVAGIVTGIVLLFVVGFFMAKSQATSASNDDVVMFEKPRGIVPVVKQVGTYSYMARNEMYKTVPVVEIMAE